MVTPSKDLAREHYIDLKDRPFYPSVSRRETDAERLREDDKASPTPKIRPFSLVVFLLYANRALTIPTAC
jgi:hypothetical protein